ncbi:efflux RND transporter periplasmic adaptor subunit [Pseudorhodoplanes sinuspersici]|uniref:Multidrug resistance protein MdtA-like C-terminal permuted SH3 domain-containing protein n=1 Tax=Pseudorhodoplanes sinuspersici TaxID=1235591 RepID=A0A1W6ZRC7_9HYPH|nr:hypothetical protein [Pseudorhodoplanes sinuspersici]ARP99825.1 hypothetical protein CAK95_12590 [Pseudorhodoplanes sinuspersici]RKE70833.1 multidrug efflux pump subunit AcrA (membrane-fusion protein) [Pseudorhodoplanes sinuspersici]
MFRTITGALIAATLAVISATPSVRAHEGHDHGPETPAAPASISPRGEAHSDNIELVAVAQGNALLFYVDAYASNAPINDATIEIETPDGPMTAKPLGDGAYRLDAPFIAKGGHLDLIATVSANGNSEILPVTIDIPSPSISGPDNAVSRTGVLAGVFGPLPQSPLFAALLGFVLGAIVVSVFRFSRGKAGALLIIGLASLAVNDAQAHEGHGEEQPATIVASEERAQRQPDGAVFVPKPIQRIFGLRTIRTREGMFQRSTELPGRVIPDPNASGYVQTALGGMLSPPRGGFPRLGTTVKQGDVLAYVTPPLQAIDVSDMRQKQGELDQQIAIVQRRLARQESLVTTGAVARAQVEETKLELEGLRDRRSGLETVRREPVPLIAPVSGVIADGTPVNGQIAQSNAIVFHIVTPGKLWVEALSFDVLPGIGSASAKTSNGQSLRLAFRGSGLADRSQSVPVHFSISDAGTHLRVGQFVTVFAETGEKRSGIAAPRSAVVRTANGQDFVFEHTNAERFEPRPVRIEPLDADRVLIAAGLETGKRLVVQGAELLDHVR